MKLTHLLVFVIILNGCGSSTSSELPQNTETDQSIIVTAEDNSTIDVTYVQVDGGVYIDCGEGGCNNVNVYVVDSSSDYK